MIGTHPEQRLLVGYREQLALYDRALAILGQAGANAGGQSALLDELHAVLVGLTKLDAALAPAKDAWRETSGASGDELRVLWQDIAARIDTLADGIGRQLEQLEARRIHLQPALDAVIQQRRMRTAYGRHGGRASHGAAST